MKRAAGACSAKIAAIEAPAVVQAADEDAAQAGHPGAGGLAYAAPA